MAIDPIAAQGPARATPLRLASEALSGVTGFTLALQAKQLSRLEFRLATTSVSGTVQATITLTGLTASYRSNQLYQAASAWAVAPFDVAATTYWAIGSTQAASSITGDVWFRTGFIRQFESQEVVSAGTVSQSGFKGFNTDTTHDVTGIVFSWGVTTLTGFIEIWGYP